MESKAVVVDNGSRVCKAGFAGDKAPYAVFPSIIGRPRREMATTGLDPKKAFYIGHEVQSKRRVLELKHPIENGIVANWDAMEKIWRHAFYELCVDPAERSVLLTEGSFTRKADRKKMAEIMFETFDISALCVVNQAVMCLYASGRFNGIVLDFGDDVSSIVTVRKDSSVPEAIRRVDLADRDLNGYMQELLTERGDFFDTFTTSVESMIVRDIKEKLSYVALDFNAEMRKAAQSSELKKDYELPNGQVIAVGDERFRCPEVLFEPSLMGKTCDGIHTEIWDAIKQCGGVRDSDMRNVVLCGGVTSIEGFVARLEKEIQPGKVMISSEHAAWEGGSIFATAVDRCFVSKAKFYETGRANIH